MGRDSVLDGLVQKVVKTAEKAQLTTNDPEKMEECESALPWREPQGQESDGEDGLSVSGLSASSPELTEAEILQYAQNLQEKDYPEFDSVLVIAEDTQVKSAETTTEVTNLEAKAEGKVSDHEVPGNAQAAPSPVVSDVNLEAFLVETFRRNPEMLQKIVAQVNGGKEPVRETARSNSSPLLPGGAEKRTRRLVELGETVRLNPFSQKGKATPGLSRKNSRGPSEKELAGQRQLQEQADGKPAGAYKGKIPLKTTPGNTGRDLPPQEGSPTSVIPPPRLCWNCRQPGHSRRNCTEAPRPHCITCGRPGRSPCFSCLRRQPKDVPVGPWVPFYGDHLDRQTIRALERDAKRKLADRRAEVAERQAQAAKKREEAAARAAETARKRAEALHQEAEKRRLAKLEAKRLKNREKRKRRPLSEKEVARRAARRAKFGRPQSPLSMETEATPASSADGPLSS